MQLLLIGVSCDLPVNEVRISDYLWVVELSWMYCSGVKTLSYFFHVLEKFFRMSSCEEHLQVVSSHWLLKRSSTVVLILSQIPVKPQIQASFYAVLPYQKKCWVEGRICPKKSNFCQMTFYVQTKRVGKRFDLKELKNKIPRHFFDSLDWATKKR